MTITRIEPLRVCPDRIAIVGGGRWARVLLEALCGIAPSSVEIVVFTRSGRRRMTEWTRARRLTNRIQLSSVWPPPGPIRPGAVIVANASRDHASAVQWALSAGVPTLVEKPIALNGETAQRLADLATERGVRLAAAHVFLFAGYIENFASCLKTEGRIDSLTIDWTDPKNEERYGERKRYDPSVPVIADCLPHVVSIAGAITGQVPTRCTGLELRRGGAAIGLELMGRDVSYTVHLERDGADRRRVLRAAAGGEPHELDFSIEPGTLRSGSCVSSGDRDWDTRPRPVACMLRAFLTWAAGGHYDVRLDVGPALQTCVLMDRTMGSYYSQLASWLSMKLAVHTTVDEDLRYALSELLQADRRLTAAELIVDINETRRRFSGAERLCQLSDARDLTDLLRVIRQ